MKLYFTFTFFLIAAWVLGQDKRVDARKLYEQGEAAHDAGNYKQALEFFNRCIRENPSFTEAYFTRASTREQLQDLSGANTDYSIYLELKPDQIDALFSRATIRYQLGLYEQSKEDLLKLLKLPVGETQTILYNRSPSVSGSNQITTMQGTILPQLFNYLGLVETKLGNFQAAITWLDSALQLQQKEPDYYVNRGIAKEALNDSTAVQDYERAISIRGDHSAALHNLAVLRRKKGESVNASDYLEKAIESDSSMLYPYLERAAQRMESGYYKGALEDYERALKIFDKDPKIWLNRGLVKEKLNDLKGAYSDYTKAIELDEKFDKAWLNRGNVLSKQGRTEEAIEDYTVAITFSPEYSVAFYNRAIARQKLKQTVEACQDLQKAESLGLAVGEKMKKEICK